MNRLGLSLADADVIPFPSLSLIRTQPYASVRRVQYPELRAKAAQFAKRRRLMLLLRNDFGDCRNLSSCRRSGRYDGSKTKSWMRNEHGRGSRAKQSELEVLA